MPEGLEAEIYRRAAERTVGRVIASVDVDDRQAMASELAAELPGAVITAARRQGKLLLLDLVHSGTAETLGLHFGMTGRLVIDDESPIAELEYSSTRDDSAWDRLTVTFADGGLMRINDPRRWARFTLDPDVERLGPDFLDVGAEHLAQAFARRRTAVKAALLDQGLVAGYGNMCVDEVLWQIGLAPGMPAREVPVTSVERLVAVARPHLLDMLERGGSHRGVIDPEVRSTLPPCPRDGTPLRRDEIGGRTTIWCPVHQTDGSSG